MFRTTFFPRPLRFAFPYRLFHLLATLILFGAFVWSYQRAGQPVTLVVNGQPFPLRTHRLTVQAVLLQTGLTLHPQDTLWPPPESGLQPGQSIEITLARPVVIALDGDGAHRLHYTRRRTPAGIFRELGIPLAPADEVYVDGRLWKPDRPLPLILPPAPGRTANLQKRIEALRPRPVRLTLRRAIPVRIEDGGQTLILHTTDRTVGDVLVAQDIPLYLGDAITPPLHTPLTPNLTITIERATPLAIRVDGRILKTRTRRPTVGEALAQEGVSLVGQDYTIPAEDAPLAPNTIVQVVRVTEALEIEKETTPFETKWIPDHNLELDRQEISQEGQEGVTKTRTRVRYENGREVSRVEEETWLEQEPADRIITYGTKVVVRTLETPDGPIEYWRKIRMLATSYSAATSGKSKDHPAYGITRTGMRAGYGVVAVDPSVIPLRTEVYVPGYGQAIAGDTGGAIIGKHIDLGFDEDSPPLWYRWVDVYLLTPAPPWHEIRYVLPQYPQER